MKSTASIFEDDLALGEWFYRYASDRFGLETERWATDQARRVERQLQVKRAPASRLTPVVLWMQEMTAFTLPGRYIYVSRELQQRLGCDDALAFVIAHEMAHHTLGHLDLFHGRLSLLKSMPAGAVAALAMRVVERLVVSPEHELAADAEALRLCLAAGYDGRKCLALFDVFEARALDMGDLEIVYGIDDPEAHGIARTLNQARTWAWEHLRGYPSIHDRRDALHTLLASN